MPAETLSVRTTRRSLLAAAAAGVAATAGCPSLTDADPLDGAWSTRGRTPARTSDAADGPEPPLDVRWTADRHDGLGPCSPVVADGTVYVGDVARDFEADSAELYVAAHDAASGERLWETPVASWDSEADAKYSDAVSVGRHVYVQTHEGLTALTTDGEVAWTADDAGSRARWREIAHPAVGEDAVYVGTYGLRRDDDADEGVVAVDPDDGSTAWEFSIEEYGDTRTLSPSVADGTVYATYLDRAVVAVDADGDRLWRRDLRARDPPTVRDGRAFCSAVVDPDADESHLFALDAATGETLWQRPASRSWPTRGIAADGEYVYYYGHHDDGLLHAREVDTGEAAWHAGVEDASYALGTPAVAEDHLYALDKEYGALQVLDRETGERLGFERAGRERGDAGSEASPAVVDGVAFYTADRTVYAVDSCEFEVARRCLY